MFRRIAPLCLLAACGTDQEAAAPGADAAPAPPATRIRLFDGMDEARLTGPDSSTAAAEGQTITYDFSEGARPDQIWFAEPRQRTLDWKAEGAAIIDEGGREGAALQLGPGVAEDYSRAVMSLPISGRNRVVVEGRIRVEGSAVLDERSGRESLRLYEHRGEAVPDPSVERNAEGRRIRRRSLDRVSRRVDASGWDRVRSEAITSADASTLELHFLHRTGGADEVVTLIDDVTVSITPLEESAYLDYLTGRYKPRDGQESLTPWRLRVSLQSEVRDSVLVRAGGELAFDLEVPPAESAPQLRFGVAALPETSRESGDGATMSAWFIDAEVETAGKQAGEAELAQGLGALELGSVTVDAKNDRDQRVWREVTFDLSAAAGRTGTLAFRVTDVDDQPDALDALLVGTPRIEPRDEPPTAPNILLIGVDTLRADHMSAFGYERDTTPNLKALADEGVRFDMARSPAPWTLPSFSSMLTSLYPSAHGAGRGGHDEWEAIDPTTVSVAEVLARNGYETAGIVANGLISPRYGLDQGFDRYRAQWAMESVEKDAPRVAEFIDGHRATPWLMFWHIMDPHLPYTTPAETRERFTDADYDGRFAEGGRGGPTVPFQVLDPRPGRRWYAHEGPPPAPDLTEADARYVGDYYDAEIAEMDAGIGVVLEAVRASGQWDRTIVAFVADHGEGLGDHNHYHHGYTLFDDQVHVPMLLRVPGGPAGQVIERPVSTVDLMPTLLGQLGIPAPEDAQGVDRLAPDAPAVDATFIEYPTYDSSAQKAWVEGPFKYLWDPLYQTDALYDFVADPAESVDVKDQYPEVVARAREALREFRLAHLSAGRFHLRVRGTKGQRLQLRVSTDDLFDANFITRPAVAPDAFEMDLDRSYLALDTVLENDRLELRCWCRGSDLRVEATLDGEPLDGLTLAPGTDPRPLPADFDRGELPERRAEDVGWPGRGQAWMWLEAGASEALPVVNTPEEADRLKELGYR